MNKLTDKQILFLIHRYLGISGQGFSISTGAIQNITGIGKDAYKRLTDLEKKGMCSKKLISNKYYWKLIEKGLNIARSYR